MQFYLINMSLLPNHAVISPSCIIARKSQILLWALINDHCSWMLMMLGIPQSRFHFRSHTSSTRGLSPRSFRARSPDSILGLKHRQGMHRLTLIKIWIWSFPCKKSAAENAVYRKIIFYESHRSNVYFTSTDTESARETPSALTPPLRCTD